MNEILPWVLFGMVNLVLLVALMALMVQRFGNRLPTQSPLFNRLADAHGLSPAHRRVLRAMALRMAMEPGVYFVSPSALAEGLTRLNRESPSLARDAEGLAAHLFGAGEAPRG